MQKTFVRNILLLLLLNLLVKPFWVLGIDRIAQNICGAHDYGQYFTLFNLCILFNIVLDLGITNYNNRNVAQDTSSLKRQFSSIFSFKLLLGIIYLAVILLVGLALSYNSTMFKLLILLAFNQFLVSMILYLRSNISGLHFFATDSFISITDKLLMIILASILIFGNFLNIHFSIVWFILVQTFAYLITFFFVFFLVIKHAGLPKINFNKSQLKQILKETFPFALLVLTMSFYYRMDAVMINKMLPNGAVQAGIYAQAYRLLDAATMLGVLFAGILLPMFSRMIKKGESINQILKLSFSMIFVPVIAIAFCVIVFAEPIIGIMYHRHIEVTAQLLKILMICFVFIATTYILGTLLTANGSLRELNTIAVLGVAVNFILNLILIPKFQTKGAAIASLSTQVWVAVAQIYFVIKKFKLKTNVKYLSSLSAFIVGSILFCFFASDLKLSWIANTVILLLAITIWSFVVRFISFKNLISMFQLTKQTIE